MGKFRTSIFLPEELQKLWTKINQLVIVIIVCFFLYFLAVLISFTTYGKSQPLIPIQCQQEILSRLKSRNLSTKTTVEITQVKGKWSYRFELDGKWYDL